MLSQQPMLKFSPRYKRRMSYVVDLEVVLAQMVFRAGSMFVAATTRCAPASRIDSALRAATVPSTIATTLLSANSIYIGNFAMIPLHPGLYRYQHREILSTLFFLFRLYDALYGYLSNFSPPPITLGSEVCFKNKICYDCRDQLLK